MAEVVSYFLRRFLVLGAVLVGSLPGVSAAQSSGWGEPIDPPPAPAPTSGPEAAPPSRAEPPPTSEAPNADWTDAPPTDFETRSPDNPDWVEETEPPPVGKLKQRASEHYDLRYANRDLTLPRGMMRGTFDTVVGRREEATGGSSEPFGQVGTLATMSFGVAISLAEDFEIGFSRYRLGSFPSLSVFPRFGFGGEGLIGFSLSPDVKFGDIPLYGRFQALDRTTVKLAFDAVFRIPVRSTFGFLLGVPLRFIVDERFAFDTGVEMLVDDNPQGPSAVWSMNIPFQFAANATDQLFFKLESGMSFFDLSQTIRTATSGLVQGPFYFIPLGVEAGYTFEARATMMDLFVDFRFPSLYGFTTRSSEVNAETWQVTIGFNVYSPILFKGSAL